MTKIDLITGFLGSGKTTFIRHYAKYLIKQGERLCILENDHGAINVDTLLLSDLRSEHCEIEMVAGGCDADCHRRRFKTKLITLAMLSFTRVIVEPSGVYDVDEFFDILHESPLDTMYSIQNVIAIADISRAMPDSGEIAYLFASQAAMAGCLVLSHADEYIVNTHAPATTVSTGAASASAREHCAYAQQSLLRRFCDSVNPALTAIKCQRTFRPEDLIAAGRTPLTAVDYEKLSHCGYRTVSFEKSFSIDESGFQALFFMNVHMEPDTLLKQIETLFHTPSVGNIIRIKGFIAAPKSDPHEKWISINATKDDLQVTTTDNGQEVLIVIGENLDREAIDRFFVAEYSSHRLT